MSKACNKHPTLKLKSKLCEWAGCGLTFGLRKSSDHGQLLPETGVDVWLIWSPHCVCRGWSRRFIVVAGTFDLRSLIVFCILKVALTLGPGGRRTVFSDTLDHTKPTKRQVPTFASKTSKEIASDNRFTGALGLACWTQRRRRDQVSRRILLPIWWDTNEPDPNKTGMSLFGLERGPFLFAVVFSNWMSLEQANGWNLAFEWAPSLLMHGVVLQQMDRQILFPCS